MARPKNPHSALSLVEKHSEFPESEASKKRIATSLEKSNLQISDDDIATYIKCYKAASGNSENIKSLFLKTMTDEQVKAENDRHFQTIKESIQGIGYLVTYKASGGLNLGALQKMLIEAKISKVESEIAKLLNSPDNRTGHFLDRLAISSRIPIAFQLQKLKRRLLNSDI